jgi:D-glycero-D-manno-heptose 1,7-bisphosphate phosphatase
MELSKEEAHLDAVYCCPHGRQDMCACKKPLAGMLVQAKGILVLTGVGEGRLVTFKHTWSNIDADFVAENVLEAVKWIIEKENL